jgi:glycerol uptake facilitator-like aquaporin
MSGTPAPALARRAVAESIGTALLLSAIVGSGIMAESLSGGDAAFALFANTMATAAALAALILTFGPISGAQLNPAVSLVAMFDGGLRPREATVYVVAQCAGAMAGVLLAHAMFERPLLMVSGHVRSGWALGLSEGVATFGLVCTVLGTSRHRPASVAFAVGAYIAAAYWFTASTSFANPAVTLARSFTDTFAGIRPPDSLWFIAAQSLGAASAAALFRWLEPTSRLRPARHHGAGQVRLEPDPTYESR